MDSFGEIAVVSRFCDGFLLTADVALGHPHAGDVTARFAVLGATRETNDLGVTESFQ